MEFNIKEVGYIIAAIVVLFFVVNFNPFITNNFTIELLLYNLLAIIIVLSINILAKKYSAYLLFAKIEFKPWTWFRYGYKPHQHFNKPLYAGLIIPIITSILSMGYFLWMSVLEFDVYSTSARVTKSQGMHRFTQITEIHLGLIAASGVIANLILAVIAYILNLPEVMRLSVFLACFSLVPIGNLDGTKIFFSGGDILSGTKTLGIPSLWATLAIICLIFLSFVLLFPY